MATRASTKVRRDLIPVTRADVYAWLLAVPKIDPADKRAGDYVRLYAVEDKIRAAKANGTYPEIIKPALGPRLRELVAAGSASTHPPHPLGLGCIHRPATGPSMVGKSLRAKNRPPEVIKREKAEKKRRRSVKEALKYSSLALLPEHTPSLSVLMDNLGTLRPDVLGHVMGVSAKTAKKWIDTDEAPRPVLMALYWITHWGVTAIAAQAHNDAMYAKLQAKTLQTEVDRLRGLVGKLGGIADFGSANDPTPLASSRLLHHLSAAPPPVLVERESSTKNRRSTQSQNKVMQAANP